MNKKIVLILLTTILFDSCKKKEEGNEEAIREVVPSELKAEVIEEKEPTYWSIQNPDTALVYFMYETYEEFLPFEYQEEYQRIDLEYDKIMVLYKSLFSGKEDFSKSVSRIDENRQNFIEKIRETVLDDYRKYNGVTGMSFNFLLTRKDSIVKPILQDLIKNKDADESEIEFAKKVLMDELSN